MLARARKLALSGDLEITGRLRHMLLNDKLTPVEYAEINDSHVKVALPDWAKHDDEIVSLYAEKLLSRKDFHKSIRIDTLTTEMVGIIKDRLEEMVSSKGYDPEIHVLYAKISKRGYMPYEQGIILEDGRDAADHSSMIRSLSQPTERALIFVPEAIRDELEATVRDWIKPGQSSLSQFD
tara:strand:+ start:85 stop:624 length:540 start_codon:yes stop_codon:yes gene_type:complete